MIAQFVDIGGGQIRSFMTVLKSTKLNTGKLSCNN